MEQVKVLVALISCRHSFHPFIQGISKRIYTDEQLDEMNAKENIKREYLGKEYTSYEATQRMRQLETRMRAQRQQIKLTKDVELDTTAELARYRQTMSEYSKFAKSMNLPEQRARIYSDSLGRM